MSERPNLQQVLTAVKDVITEWHELGIHLGLPEPNLKLIGSNPDVEGHLRMMVSKWLDYDPQASWNKLANALETMGKNCNCCKYQNRLCGWSSSSSFYSRETG